jgi:hypothetical protein
MKVLIKNLRVERPTEPWQVRVDRSSVLGNPFPMRNESERDEVCDAYAVYFKKQFESNEAFKNELRRLYKIGQRYGRLELFCWCAPKRCHAETIKAFLEQW